VSQIVGVQQVLDRRGIVGPNPLPETNGSEHTRHVRSVKQECLSTLILFGERPLLRTLTEFSAHYHRERNDQGKGNKLLFPMSAVNSDNLTIPLLVISASEACSSITGASA
jgi:hypothetical protein